MKLTRIISTSIILFFLNFFSINFPILYLLPYLIIGHDILLKALRGIINRQIFDENFLMASATLGALILGEYSEASAVMIFYQLGELFQDYAADKSKKNIAALMDIKPDYANIERNGKLEKISPEKVEPGTIITVKPGEKIPIDGEVADGISSIDARALTGESLPKDIKAGDKILSGCINLSGVLKVKTTCDFKNSTASRILELIENASSRKSHSEKFISRFAEVYTPIVCGCALALAVIPSIIEPSAFRIWLYRALTFLVISCPCALVISVPLAFFAGIGGAGKSGILVKGSNFLEALAKVSCFVFDKTGTLTRGVFEVTAVHTEIINENELLHLAAHVERYSNHPAAEALRRAYPDEADNCKVDEAKEIAGYGVQAKVNGRIICAGNSRFMEMIKAQWHPCEKSGTIIHVAINGEYAGHVVISDVLKENSRQAINELRASGIDKIIMLTGDAKPAAEETAMALGIEDFKAELLPEDKAAKIEELNSREKTAFVGDGINDAPVLARADIGFAMGALGSDAAIEAADIVLMDDDILKVPKALRISRKVMRIVWENIYFSLSVKILCLILGAFGLASMWLAVFADVGIMVIAVINAVRAMFVKNL